MTTAEHSYFNFLMEYRRARRVPIPFVRAVGVMPERTPVNRACLFSLHGEKRKNLAVNLRR
jgi:hypothetical protein